MDEEILIEFCKLDISRISCSGYDIKAKLRVARYSNFSFLPSCSLRLIGSFKISIAT